MLVVSDANIFIDLEVGGLLWVGEHLVEEGLIGGTELSAAYAAMKDGGRFLPWDLVGKQLKALGIPLPDELR